ncbi:MAG: hypothetical protein JST52_03055 [Bacteroidetes bacterium]|nr:hypothetical protein [Bacteroidota bacterium]
MEEKYDDLKTIQLECPSFKMTLTKLIGFVRNFDSTPKPCQLYIVPSKQAIRQQSKMN